MSLPRRQILGFTLIEILVATSIMSLVFVIGFAGFRDFSRRQQLVSLARQLQGELRNAQELALSGTKPNPAVPNCSSNPNVLVGYSLAVATPTSYTITPNCSGGFVTPLKTINLPTGYTITPAGQNVRFKPLGQGTTLASGSTVIFTLTQASSNTSTAVTVTASGEIK